MLITPTLINITLLKSTAVRKTTNSTVLGGSTRKKNALWTAQGMKEAYILGAESAEVEQQNLVQHKTKAGGFFCCQWQSNRVSSSLAFWNTVRKLSRTAQEHAQSAS